MNAICKKCDNLIWWHAYRGTKLKNLRCICGGELRKNTEEEWRRYTERKKVIRNWVN